jgi:hypothetical protein
MARYEDIFLLKDKVSKSLVKISHNLSKFDKKIGASQRKLEQFKARTENIAKLGNKIKSVGQSMTVGLTLPIIAAGGAMVKMASDMEETINKVDVSFGNSSDKVKEWAKDSIKSMGLAQQSALDSAALYGDMATGMGLSQEKASQMAMSLTQLGADLASFKNISNDVAKTALKSIFTGETESLKNLGVVMTQTNLEQFAMSKGIRKKIKDMTEAEKIQLRYNYVMEQTKNAHGDFIRTGGGASNQMRMFQENLKELGVTFGQYILPYFTAAVKKLNEMLVAFNNLSPGVKKTILVIGAILAVIGPALTVIGSLIASVNLLNTALRFLAANPIVIKLMLIIAAIYGLIKAIQFLIQKIQHFKRMKMPTMNTNFSEEERQKLIAIRDKIGKEEFAKQYGKDVAKSLNKSSNTTNNNNSVNNSNNTTNTYNINNYGNNNIDKLTANAKYTK